MTSKELINVSRVFHEFDGQAVTKELRVKLTKAIKQVCEEHGFKRTDKDKIVQLKWHTEPSLSPEIEIGLTTDGKFWICDDSLWRTIEGIHESEQERRAYTRGF